MTMSTVDGGRLHPWSRPAVRGLVFVLGYSVSAFLVGLGLSMWSTQVWQPGREWWLSLSVLGLLIGSWMLYWLHRFVCFWLSQDRPESPETRLGAKVRWLRTSKRVLLVALFAYLVVAGTLVVLAVEYRSSWVALVGMWLAGAALAAVTASLRRGLVDPKTNKNKWWQARYVTSVGLALLAAAAVVVVLLPRFDIALVFGSLVAVLGLATVSLGFLEYCYEKSLKSCAFGLGVSCASAVTIAALWVAGAPVALFVPPVVLCLLGLAILGRGVPVRIREGDLTSVTWGVWTYALLSAGIGAVGAMMFASHDWQLASALSVSVIIAILAFALVSETFQLVTVLLLGGVMAFVIDVRIVPTEADLNPDATAERLVVFGDSYISGEGASRYLSGTNTVGVDECRRAPTSYAYLLAEEDGKRLDFYACSGATTEDVAGSVAGSRTQLQHFLDDEIDPSTIEAVLVSVGGNDAWFGTVGQACLGPGSCDVHRDTLFRNVEDIVDRIEAVYVEIRKSVGESVPVVAMPYPLTLTDTGCGSSMLLGSEHRFLFEFTDVLNSAVRVAAKRAGVNFFGPGITVFNGHRICDEEQAYEEQTYEDLRGEVCGGPLPEDEVAGLAVNVIDIRPKEGALMDRILPTHWFHGSAHPNELGHSLTKVCLKSWLSTVEGNPPPDPWAERSEPPPGQRPISTRLLGIPGAVLVPSELRVAGELPEQAAVVGADGPYTLPTASVGSFVHHSQPTGEWSRLGPVQDAVATTVPAWGEAQFDCSANEKPRPQVIVWQTQEEEWQVVVREYCSISTDEIVTGSLDVVDDLNWLPVPSELPVSAETKASVLGSPYSLPTVRVDSFVFYSQPNGEWSSLGPIPDDASVNVPGWDRATQLDFDAAAMEPRQVIIWRPAYGTWEIVVREYCELDPDCPDNRSEINAWTGSQFARTIELGLLPVAVLFLGAWFLAILIAVDQGGAEKVKWRLRLFPWRRPRQTHGKQPQNPSPTSSG